MSVALVQQKALGVCSAHLMRPKCSGRKGDVIGMQVVLGQSRNIALQAMDLVNSLLAPNPLARRDGTEQVGCLCGF